MHTRHLALLLAASLALMATTVSAAVITSGYILDTSPTTGAYGGTFDFIGSGFSVAGGFDDSVVVGGCGPCFAGGLVNVTGVVGAGGGADLGSAGFTLGGSTSTLYVGDFDETPFFSNFKVTGAPITLVGAGTYETAFSMSGQFCGVPMSQATSAQACTVSMPTVTGSGVAQVTVEAFAGPSGQTWLEETNAAYYFTVPTDPPTVPEPGTVSLLALGLASIVLLSRKVAPRP